MPRLIALAEEEVEGLLLELWPISGVVSGLGSCLGIAHQGSHDI